MTVTPPFIRGATSAIFMLLTGCAQGVAVPDAPRAVLYRSDASVQCEAPGKTISATRNELEVAGVQVLAATCGTNGRAQMALCGSGTGRIHIVEVPERQAKVARALGFALLTDLPEANRIACR